MSHLSLNPESSVKPSICSILALHAERFPDRPLFVFPETRWRGAASLTFADLAARGGAAARAILSLARPGDRALLMFPTGPEFWEAFFGCLAAGVIAVPLKTPNLNRPSEQLERVVRDCAPTLIIADDESAGLLNKRADLHPYLAGVRVLDPSAWRGESAGLTADPAPNDLAYLQYTSGSTSQPKAIQISHANLLANLELIRDRMDVEFAAERTVTWLPHFHDMGLVGSYLGSILNVVTAWCLPPEEFGLYPQRWLQLISEHRATICGGPNFGFRHCLEKVKDADLAGLDLSSWRVAFIGAERIQPETLGGFVDRFAPSGFRANALFPCYGLGEATLLVTGGPADAPPVLRTVSRQAQLQNRLAPPLDEADHITLSGCGQTGAGCEVVIGDPSNGTPLPDESIGEVLVRGPAVTRGYYRRDDINAQLFREGNINGETRRYLRTGDLGFLSDGELFITGRRKELMIVRGRNLYPDDLEGALDGVHESLAPGRAVAFSCDHDGQEALFVAAELRRSALKLESAEPVFAAIRAKIVQTFGVNPQEIILLRPATIPSTSSGKLQRLQVRESYATGRLDRLFSERSGD
ncbi:MAG: fatty acyl-AMP ligase [Planctomycetaceae bacterium]|nr:fatty acyl-AMP ligase [Planctomycetaceae bacterium]